MVSKAIHCPDSTCVSHAQRPLSSTRRHVCQQDSRCFTVGTANVNNRDFTFSQFLVPSISFIAPAGRSVPETPTRTGQHGGVEASDNRGIVGWRQVKKQT